MTGARAVTSGHAEAAGQSVRYRFAFIYAEKMVGDAGFEQATPSL